MQPPEPEGKSAKNIDMYKMYSMTPVGHYRNHYYGTLSSRQAIVIHFKIGYLGTFLLTWFNFNPSMDKSMHPLHTVGWNYVSIPNFEE